MVATAGSLFYVLCLSTGTLHVPFFNGMLLLGINVSNHGAQEVLTLP